MLECRNDLCSPDLIAHGKSCPGDIALPDGMGTHSIGVPNRTAFICEHLAGPGLNLRHHFGTPGIERSKRDSRRAIRLGRGLESNHLRVEAGEVHPPLLLLSAQSHLVVIHSTWRSSWQRLARYFVIKHAVPDSQMTNAFSGQRTSLTTLRLHEGVRDVRFQP